MNRHAGPPRGADEPVSPEPTFAERARTLAHLGRTGTLATLSREHPGHPFGVRHAVRARRPRAGPLVPHQRDGHAHAEPPGRSAREPARDPARLERRSAGGRPADPAWARRVVSKRGGAAGRAAYLARHRARHATGWISTTSAFWRLDVLDVYFVGGFAAMDWVTAAAYAAAAADPLADAGGGIVEHMNATTPTRWSRTRDTSRARRRRRRPW